MTQKQKDTRPLTPEILTAAGWTMVERCDHTMVTELKKEYKENYQTFYVSFFSNVPNVNLFLCGGQTLQIQTFHSITVGEFNTLLDIVKLQKFKVNE